jgi:hypothetical protein
MPDQFISNLSNAVIEETRGPVAAKLLPEYGAIFVARNGAVPPGRLVFRDENEVQEFQNLVAIGSLRFGDIAIELQKAAADALSRAVTSAAEEGLSITPRSADSGRRSYHDTVELWQSRIEPALDHWVGLGDLTPEAAAEIRARSPFDQVPLVFELESRGLWFAKDLAKSIIYSVAPPGASQHLSMLAFDVMEFNDSAVRNILAAHFWYQTVVSDLPHFTYLGVSMENLSELGLKQVSHADHEFWVPDI